MKTTKLLIKTNVKNYPILIGHKLVSKISKIMDENSIKFEKCLLIKDKNVPKKFVNEIVKGVLLERSKFALAFGWFVSCS